MAMPLMFQMCPAQTPGGVTLPLTHPTPPQTLIKKGFKLAMVKVKVRTDVQKKNSGDDDRPFL
jgi:hypothetical protein